MDDVEAGGDLSSLPSSGSPGPGLGARNLSASFEHAKRLLLVACVTIGGGLAIAGSVDRTSGGVLVLVGWLSALVSLHRLGRAGSDGGSTPAT